LRSVDFIRKYICPGGCLPSVNALFGAVAAASDLRPLFLQDLTPHYVLTLQRWREQFWSRIEDVRRQGFDEAFIRMWDYYFAYCEAAFSERQTGLVHLLWGKPQACLPETAEV
jgi:cyclopropane-fatty-acyl-phospholipid synthase